MKDGLFTIGFVAFLAFRQFSNYWVSTSVNSVEELEPDMPLLELKRSRFDEQALARLWEGLEKLERETQGEESAKPERLGGVFEKTTGWALKFNREGRSRLAGDDGWGFLQEYVDAVADSATNAFMLNCVIIPPQGVVAVPSSEDFEPAVGMHLDDTAGIDSARHYLAHSVSVLYLNVPVGMKGGELLLLRHTDAKSSESAGSKEMEKRAHAKVSPEEGLLATFRGDAYRGVTALAAEAATDDDDELLERKSDSALGTARVSLVLEQYRIPSHLYKATTTFEATAGYAKGGKDRRQGGFYESSVRKALSSFNDVSRVVVVMLVVFGVVSTLRAMVLGGRSNPGQEGKPGQRAASATASAKKGK